MSEQVTNLTPDQRRQVFDVLETLRECADRLSYSTISVRPPYETPFATAGVDMEANGGDPVAEVYAAFVGSPAPLAIFHRIQEPPPPLCRRREWYWDLARPADAKELERAIAIIRSLEVPSC